MILRPGPLGCLTSRLNCQRLWCLESRCLDMLPQYSLLKSTPMTEYVLVTNNTFSAQKQK